MNHHDHHDHLPDDFRDLSYTSHHQHLPIPGREPDHEADFTADQPPTGRPTDRLDAHRPPTSADGSEVPPTLPLARSGNHAAAPARRAATVLPRLSDRDLRILRELARFRLMTGRQLQLLFVHSSNHATAVRRSRQLLTRLRELGLVQRLGRRIGGIQAGSAGHVYGLTGLGHAVLALDPHSPPSRYGRTVWETAPAFQDHLLAIAEAYVGLRSLERTGTVEVLTFDTEPEAWRGFTGPAGERVRLKPDAFVALGVGELELRLFLEIDRGTESLPTVMRKCRRYLDYWHTGNEQHQFGVFPRVWWLTESPRREARIARLIADLPPDERDLFATGLLTDAPGVLLSDPDNDVVPETRP